jgi:hypothetical protein
MSSTDRIALLEAEVAELRALVAPRARHPYKPRLLRRLALIGLVLALTIPAGVVLANHQFSDVPTSSSIHDDVEALVEAGVTTGCGGGKYCPANAVTRGQMAQFLNRLGALDGQAPSVNADRVDGKHANALIRVANWQTTATTLVPLSGTVQYGPNLVITAPAEGFVAVNIGYSIVNSSCTASCRVVATVEHVETGASSLPTYASATTSEVHGSASIHRVFAVAAGVNTFQLILNRVSPGTGELYGWYGTGDATYSPYGSTGGATLGFDSAEVDAAKLEE